MSKSYSQASEALIFGSLKKDIMADLIGNGIPEPLAAALIKWCDPAEDSYLRHVDLWQTLLCQSRTEHPDEFPQSFFDFGVIHRSGSFGTLTASVFWVQQIHQVVRMFYKFHGTPRKETDWEEVKNRFRRPGKVALEACDVEAVRSVLSALKPPRSWADLSGRFGPGITAEGLDKLRRWEYDGKFPINVPLCLYDLAFIDSLFGEAVNPQLPPGPHTLEYLKYGITKVAEVPKSIKTNRFVSSEPAMFMFAQLAVGDYLVSELHRCFPNEISLDNQVKHRSHLTDRQTRRFVERSGNRKRVVTYGVPYATIDLSDASDHVSRALIHKLLPEWNSFLFSARSTFARFPDGELVPLRTFAPMGSGLCFPVLTAVVYGLLKSVCGRDAVYVYGDDAIVPLDKYDACVAILSEAGLVVNMDKSSPTGRYREACGCEMYSYDLQPIDLCGKYRCDFDVTPVLIRDPPWKVDSATLELWASKLAQLHWDRTRDALIAGSKARVRRMRWNNDIQRLEVEVFIDRPRHVRYEWLSGRAGLARWYAIRSQQDLKNGRLTGDIHIPSSDMRRVTSFEDASAYPALTTWFITRLQE